MLRVILDTTLILLFSSFLNAEDYEEFINSGDKLARGECKKFKNSKCDYNVCYLLYFITVVGDINTVEREHGEDRGRFAKLGFVRLALKAMDEVSTHNGRDYIEISKPVRNLYDVSKEKLDDYFYLDTFHACYATMLFCVLVILVGNITTLILR